LLHQEPGAEFVEDSVDRAAMSAVNWSEVYRRWVAHGADVSDLRVDVEALGVRIVAFTVADAEHAVQLWPATRVRGLSLADRACLALARRLGVPALTADGSWLGLDLDVEVQPIR
jgi:PIN domain nuclease of toxin-antitoxin system